MSSPTKPLSFKVKSIFRNVTPVRLRLMLVGNCLFAIIIAMLGVTTINQHKHALQTVGFDAAPSVVAAHNIKMGVARMNGTLADEFLSTDADTIKQSEFEFEAGRKVVCQSLVAAAKNITYGPTEEKPIEEMQLAFSKFLMQAQFARDQSGTQSLDESWSAYRAAFDTVEKRLAPNSDALCAANLEILEATYADEKSRSTMLCSLVLALGLILAALLVAAQIYLRIHFRRLFNPPLMFATVLSLVFAVHVYDEVRQSSERLRGAKEDSYDSIFAVVSAHSAIYTAKAAASRYLLDRENAAQYEKAYFNSIASIARFTPGHDFDTALKEANEKMTPETHSLLISGMSGALAEEFASIEYIGEGEAATEILQALKDYVEADKRMRQLEKSGQHDEAVKMCLSYAPGGLKFYFGKLDDAMERALKINRVHFTQQVLDAFNDLTDLVTLCEMFALLAVSSIYLGLRARLSEYS